MVLKFLKKAFLFLCICGTTYPLICFLIPQVWVSKNQTGVFGFTLTRFRELQALKSDSMDIVFVGASNCYRTFDNRLYAEHSLRTFILSTTSQTPLNSYFLLKEYFEKLKPKVIVLELSPGGLMLQDGQESFLNIAVNHPITENIIKMGIANKKLNCINTLVSEIGKRKLKPLSGFIEHTPYVKYIKGGYVEDTTRFIKQNEIKPFSCASNQLQLEYLNKIIDFLKTKNVIIVTTMQSFPSIYNEKAKDIADYRKWIKIFSKEKGMIYIPTEELILDDRNDFADILHLNNNGAQKFNKYFLKQLSDLAIIN